MRNALLLIPAVLVSACASIRSERGFDQVDAIVRERTGLSTGWGEGDPGREALSRHVDELLEGGLTRDRAIRIALLNNPELQVTYADLGISQADLLEAGLLSNPVLAGSIGLPISRFENDRLEYEASLVHGLLELIVLPLRKRVAEEQFIADTLRVAHRTLETTAEVNKAFVRHQAAERLLEVQRIVLQAAMARAADAEARYRAGNTTRLEVDTQRAVYEEARQALADAEIDGIETREELNRVLGLWGPRTDWTLAEPLPDMLAKEPDLEDLESLAIRQRLDIDAARKRMLLMHNAVTVARTSRYTGIVEVGVHIHQDPDGPRLLGPTLSIELPIFNQRQATIARLESQRVQAERQLDALSVATRSAVRATGARLMGIRQRLEHQRTVLLPLRERIVDATRRQYNAMQIGLPQLLEAQQRQVEEYRGYLDTLRDYWIVRTELERLVGGNLHPPTATREETP